MKKLFLSLSMLLVALLPARAFEFPGFEWEVGAEVTSKYLWRGMNLGGLAFQPTASVGYGGAKLEVWANLSPNDYTFKEFTPELDLTLSYQLKGIWVSINHQHYFNGYKYFDYKGETTNQLEVGAGIDFQDLFDKIGLRFSWQTYVAGDDHYETDKLDANGNKIAMLDENGSIVLDENGNTMYETELKRAYSTYFEVAYKFGLPLGFSLTPIVGFTPKKSMYTFYEGNFAVNNIALRADFDFEFANHFALNVYAQMMMNTYGMKRENLFINSGVIPWANDTRWNFAIGAGIWIF